MGYDFSLTEKEREENRKKLSLFKAMLSYQADPSLEIPNFDKIFEPSPVKKKSVKEHREVELKKKNKNKSNKLL